MESGLGTFDRDVDSLASRFNTGYVGVDADLINAIIPPGPRDMLRRLRSVSLDRTRSSEWPDFEALGLFAEEPGLLLGFAVGSAFLDRGFAGDGITGPPSFRLTSSHCWGSRAE